MTVTEAIGVLTGAEQIKIAWGGFAAELRKTDELMMDAYGDYVVKSIISGFDKNTFEIQIAMKPVKMGALHE